MWGLLIWYHTWWEIVRGMEAGHEGPLQEQTGGSPVIGGRWCILRPLYRKHLWSCYLVMLLNRRQLPRRVVPKRLQRGRYHPQFAVLQHTVGLVGRGAAPKGPELLGEHPKASFSLHTCLCLKVARRDGTFCCTVSSLSSLDHLFHLSQ